MNTSAPQAIDTPGGIVEEIALDFLAAFKAFERALTRRGFTQTGRWYRQGLPDWEGYARYLEPRLDRNASPVAQSAGAYLLCTSIRKPNGGGPGNHYPEDRLFRQSDTLWIALVIRAAGERLAHGLVLPAGDLYEEEVWLAGRLILEAWAECDPEMGMALEQGLPSRSRPDPGG